MSTAKKKNEEEALASQKKLEAQAAADAERIKADGGVWKITLEDQAKYEAEHRKKKAAKASGAVSSKAGAAGGGYTPGAYYGGTDASAVKGKAGKTGAGSFGMSTGALKAALRRENDLQTAYRDYVQEADAQAARQAKTPAMQRLKERKKAEIETAFDDYAENGLKDMYKAALEREVKQAREDEAWNALLKEKEIAKKSAENIKKANSSALDKARNSSVAKSGSAADFYKNRSETMGRGVIGDLENLEKIKNRDLGAELKLEGQKLKYQWEEAGRRYDKLSDEEKNDLYKKRNSSALERARMQEVPGGSTAQETRNRISNDIYERYKKLDEESRDPAKAEKYAFINRLRSAAGEGVENFGLWLYETFGYEPGKETYDRGEARAIGEVANEQVQRLVDAAPSQIGKDLVKVSDSVAQQLSYKILTAPISLFGGSIIADKVLSKTGSFAAAEKAARDFTGGTYTAGMASSSAADKYVQCRAEGQGKLEASIRAMGTGLISYFSESLGGIGGSKSPLGGLEEKYAESLIGSILYNAFEEGGEEFVEYLGDYLLDGAVDLAARGEWQQEWSWEEVIENAKIGAMSGGLFGGYNKLQNAVYSRIDEANAIRLEKAAREYSDYMKNAYRLMNDPNLREIAERRIGDTAIPSAVRTASRETGEMNFGNVLREKPGTVSAEQMYGVKQPAEESGNGVITDEDVAKPVDFKSMYGVKLSQENKNEDFAEWNESNKKQAQIDGERVNALSLKERLTMIANKAFPKTLTHVKLGEMPETIRETIGIDNGEPLVMSRKKAYAAMMKKSDVQITDENRNVNWHGLGTDGLEKVVAALESPLRAVKQENGRYGFVVEIEEGGKPYYAIVELDTKGNYQGKVERANVVVSAFGTNLKYIENQMRKGTELPIKKRTSSARDLRATIAQGVNETDSNGDVPSPKTNIPQNGNAVNNKNEKIEASAESKVTLDVKKSTDNDDYTYDSIAIMLDGKEVGTIGMMVDENEPYLERIDIDEEYRNKGIGTDALRLAAEKYGDFLIAPDNEDAKRLYERYGEESNSDVAAYIDQGYGVYEISSVPEDKGYMARQRAQQASEAAARTQQNTENAAKAQQAETEEEARLRTLYESEPTGKYAETEAGESKAQLDSAVEEAKQNAVTDEQLKEKPEGEKQKILRRRIEKAGLDMTVEEIVGFAQGLGRIKGFFGSERKDFARIFDDVSEGSRTIRNDLHKLLEVPHRQAQAQYTESYKNAVKAISDKFAKLGIKAGSKESAAVQRIGEHAYQIDSKGNTAEYTYEMLKRDFPDSWEKIAEAAKFTRNIYDDYLKKLNAMYESIYPQTVEKAEERRSKLNAEAQRMSDYKDSLNEVKKALRENVDKKKAALAKSKDGTQKKADLKRQIATLEARMKAVDSKMAAADSRAFAAKLKSELIKSQIENGEILKNKQIKPRQDYFRHFQELNSNFAELTDIFTNDQNISPGLIGVSAETKPRTMWSSIAQARAKTHAYTEDAVGGLLKYAQTAETLLAYNPLISRYRDISAAIRTAAVMADEKVSGTGTNASRFAAYLDDWTNNIAGKSYVLDRYFERAGTNGRAILKAFEKINGIVKKGSLLHNVMSSAKQISNLPYASAYIPNPKDWISGAIASAESQFGKTETANALREARSQSSFMNERYLDNSIDKLTRAIMNDGIKEKNERFGAAMLGALDRAAAEYIWNTAYGYYLKNPGKADEKMGRDYDSAIDYADDITRRTVAGRGRGETALAETSKLMGLVAPFQVEVNNTANLMAEQLGKRNAAGLIAVEINVYLMNSLLEAVLGDRPIGFDYISVVEDVLREAFGGGDDDDDEKKKPEAIDIAKNFAAKFAGETLSSLPMGAQIAQIITAGDEKLAQKLFSEDRDPTRYGTGNIGVSGAIKAGQFVWDLFGGKYSVGSNEERWRMALDAADAIAPIVSPFGIGGRQLARTLRGAHSMAEGGVYGYDSEGKRYLKYAQGNSAADWAKAILMGEYATDAGREYVEGGFKSLSAKDTTLMNIAEGLGVPKELFYDTVLGMKKQGNNREKQKWLFENESLNPGQKRIIDALYFGNGEEAVAAARKEADLAGASTNKNDFYDILSGKLSSKRDYSGSYAFENSGYTGKVQGQIRAAEGAEITREQLFSVLAGTKNKNLPDKMAEVYSTEGLTPEQQDKLCDIVLGDDGKGRRESYAAANVSISDRVLMEEILSDYSAQKKQTGDGEADELVKKTFIMDKLMAEGKSKYEAYRLYKIQDGNWINSIADLSDGEKKRAGAAKKQYGLSESDYVIIKNYSGLAEGEKDKYGNTVSGSNREDNIKNLAKLLHCSEEEAERRLTIATGCAYSVEELSSSARDKLETGRKYGWTDEKWLKAANAIELSGVTKKEEKIKVLRDAGFSSTEAAGYYNLNAGNDYYSSKAAGTPYGLNSGQYDKTKYWSEKSGKSEKEVAGYFKAIKGLTKKVDIIAALEAAGMSSSEANEFYALRQGRDSGYKAYKNGE